jgi:hypothetical protein
MVENLRDLDLTQLARLRRAAEQMVDTEYLMDIEVGSGIPMDEGRGGVFQALGYYGTPGSEEGQVEISNYWDPIYFELADGRVSRRVGEYFKKPTKPRSLEDKKKIRDYKKLFNFTGEPPSVGGISLDRTIRDPVFYGDIFRHELRHRGIGSDALEKLRKDSLASGDPNLLGTKINLIKSEVFGIEDVFENLRELAQGERSYDEMSKQEKARLDIFDDVEKALLNSLTEEDKMKLGLFSTRESPYGLPNSEETVDMADRDTELHYQNIGARREAAANRRFGGMMDRLLVGGSGRSGPGEEMNILDKQILLRQLTNDKYYPPDAERALDPNVQRDFWGNIQPKKPKGLPGSKQMKRLDYTRAARSVGADHRFAPWEGKEGLRRSYIQAMFGPAVAAEFFTSPWGGSTFAEGIFQGLLDIEADREQVVTSKALEIMSPSQRQEFQHLLESGVSPSEALSLFQTDEATTEAREEEKRRHYELQR